MPFFVVTQITGVVGSTLASGGIVVGFHHTGGIHLEGGFRSGHNTAHQVSPYSSGRISAGNGLFIFGVAQPHTRHIAGGQAHKGQILAVAGSTGFTYHFHAADPSCSTGALFHYIFQHPVHNIAGLCGDGLGTLLITGIQYHFSLSIHHSGIILGFIWIIKEYIKTKKNYLLATMLILLIVGIYSFTTYTGAARLQIALQGYIVEAYDMGLEELVYYQEKNSKRYAPIENIEVEEGQLGFVEVDNYLGIKIGTYVGY